MSKNSPFRKAKDEKNDEFYTQITDIENELKQYREHFKNKHVFLNCDDPDYSNFWKFFYINFEFLDLKHLTATHYSENNSSFRIDYYADKNGQINFEQTELMQNGDFRSPESLEILKECDIVVTNPPFSLFREYILQLVDFDKKFLIIGSQNNITYKETFPLLRDNKMWVGVNHGDMAFKVPDYYPSRETRFWIDEDGQKWRSFGNICWFTNLDYPQRHDEMILYKQYNPEEYPTYDEYNAIEVSKVKNIPMDYEGLMGVPITFLNKYNPAQFKIIGLDRYVEDNPHYGRRFKINGKEKYARILIQNKNPMVL